MIDTSEYTIDVMSAADLDLVIDWAAAESWNPGLTDAACFRITDPSGFLIGRLDGRPISSISAVRYGDRFGFLGFYIVTPEARGEGYGLRIWEVGLRSLGDRVIGLDGVPAQVANYRKSGFEVAHNNTRYGGDVDRATLTPTAASERLNVRAEDIDPIVAYDRQFFPASRETFIRQWLTGADRTAKVIRRDGGVAGYGVIRRCRSGSKIGPLFADSPSDADLLFRALVSERPKGPVFLDVPDPNAEAKSLARRYGLAPVFETARMYRGPAPHLPWARTFGITTFELG